MSTSTLLLLAIGLLTACSQNDIPRRETLPHHDCFVVGENRVLLPVPCQAIEESRK